jgi:hypothetical protein
MIFYALLSIVLLIGLIGAYGVGEIIRRRRIAAARERYFERHPNLRE